MRCYDSVWIGSKSTLDILVSRHPLMRKQPRIDPAVAATAAIPQREHSSAAADRKLTFFVTHCPDLHLLSSHVPPNYQHETRSQCSHPPSSCCVWWFGNAQQQLAGWQSHISPVCSQLRAGCSSLKLWTPWTVLLFLVELNIYLITPLQVFHPDKPHSAPPCPNFPNVQFDKLPVVSSQPVRTGPISIKRGGATAGI